MNKPTKKSCEHNLFPVAIDFEDEFAFYECSACGDRFWRNVHRVDEVEGDA